MAKPLFNMYQGTHIQVFTSSQAIMGTILPVKQAIRAIPKKDLAAMPWAPWGSNNMLPKQYADDIENCPVLGAVLNSKSRLAVGRGIFPCLLFGVEPDGTEILEGVVDAEINDWLETNKIANYAMRTILNINAYGFSVSQMVRQKGGKGIATLTANDAYNVRLQKMADDGFIKAAYISGQWENMNTTGFNDIPKVPLLQEGNEYYDFTQTKANEVGILHRMVANGKLYYPTPLWQSAKAWVKISRSVPAFKNALHANQMSIKYIVTISPYYWEKSIKGFSTLSDKEKEDAIKAKYKDINDYLTGEMNAGKTIFSGSYIEPHTKVEVKDIQIEVLDDKHKDGKMLPDNAAADKQIAFANFYNPAIIGSNLLGDGASGGAGSGSDIREAVLSLLMQLQPERSMALECLNIVKKANGWAERLQKPTIHPKTGKTVTPILVFRFQNSILTTLDTGKQSQNTTT